MSLLAGRTPFFLSFFFLLLLPFSQTFYIPPGVEIWEVVNDLSLLQEDDLYGEQFFEDASDSDLHLSDSEEFDEASLSDMNTSEPSEPEAVENWYKLSDAEPPSTSHPEDLVPELPLEVEPVEGMREFRARLLADLDRPGQRIEICTGGEGGRGNSSFRDSNYRRFNRYSESGVREFRPLGLRLVFLHPLRPYYDASFFFSSFFPSPHAAGDVKRLILELKLIADCGLVGFPNAGKSSLLTKLTRVRLCPPPTAPIIPFLF